MSEPMPQDYKDAVNGTGPLAHEWADKPHRLVYDLASALTVATKRAEAAEAEREAERAVIEAAKAWHAAPRFGVRAASVVLFAAIRALRELEGA